MKISVITISDRAFNGVYEDLSGPEIRNILTAGLNFGEDLELSGEIIPDEFDEIITALDGHKDADIIITTGGTGIGPRDVTPEAAEQWCDKSVPGIAEALRTMSLGETMSAMLSRGYSGIKDRTLVVTLPGSVKAVRSCTTYLVPVLAHAVRMMAGKGH
jgi:molybdopterin adenylyltransferase